MSDIILNKVNSPPSDIAPGESAISVDNSTGEPQVTDGDTGVTKPFAGAFGGNFQLEERTDEQTTTSNQWQTYLTSNINNLNANNLYRLMIRFTWGYGSASTDFEARLLVNNVQYGEIMKVEPKDGGGDQRIPGLFLAYLSAARFPDFANNNQVQLQFRASNNGNQARVYDAVQEFWRIT